MTATNHTLTGIAIAATVPGAAIALPAAFFAHFVLDALPHFDFFTSRKSRGLFARVLAVDGILAAAILLTVFFMRPEQWVLLIAGGVMCAIPDLMWMPNFIREMRGKRHASLNVLQRFHKNIQWGEHEWGIWVELVWAAAIIYALAQFVF